MAYNKDLQEDKEAVFDTVDTVKISLQVASIVLNNLRVNEEKTRHRRDNRLFECNRTCRLSRAEKCSFSHRARYSRKNRDVCNFAK